MDLKMYRILAFDEPTDKAGYVVHDPRVNVHVSEGKLSVKAGEMSNLSLTINEANPLFGNVKPMHTHVEVYDGTKIIFRGRALKPTREMKDSGQFLQTYVFEDITSYLIDSVQRYIEVTNATPNEFLTQLIAEHNSQVPAYKQFQMRKCTVTNKKDNALRKVDYQTTRDAIKKLLTDSIGGYIVTEYKGGKNYIDYLADPGIDHKADTPIRITENMQSAKVDIDPSKVVTRLVPLGAQIETQNPDKKHDDSTDGSSSGPMEPVNGDWKPVIRFAAKCMGITPSERNVDLVAKLIKNESNGNETIVNNWDANAQAGHPSIGLMQYIQTTFDYYHVDGFNNIKKGFHQLLHYYNDSNWETDVGIGVNGKEGEWVGPMSGPSGKSRMTKPVINPLQAGTGGGWGSPFPSVGHVAFEGGQLFGVHAGGEFRQNGFHDGLDFGTAKYPGSKVHAIHGMKITRIGYMGGLGWFFVGHSDDGYNIDFQEAFGGKSDIYVKVGQYVKTGDVVGVRTTNHLHIGITKKDFDYALRYAFSNNGTWIDPEPLIFGKAKQTRSAIPVVTTKTASVEASDSPLAKQSLDIQAGVDLFNKAKAAHLQYSMTYQRENIKTDQKHADCSSFVSYFLELALHETDRTMYNTESLHGFLTKHGYSLHYEGTNHTLPAMQAGDVIIMGKKGQSAGAAGHTAVMKDGNTVLECSSGWPGNYNEGGADVFEHGSSGNPTLANWFKYDADHWSGNWYWYLYRFGGNIPEQESGDQKGGTIKSGVRYTIAPVNDGKDYLDIPDFQKEFGIINGFVTWDDVKDPTKLLAKAKDWIKNQKASTNTFTITALELPDYDKFQVYDRYMFINPYVANTQLLTIVSKEIDINKPHKSSLTIGDKKARLTDYQGDFKKVSKDLKMLTSRVSTISGDVSAMRGGAGGNGDSQIEKVREQLGTVNVPQMYKDFEGVQEQAKDTDTRLTTTETDVETIKKSDEATQQTLDDYKKTIDDLTTRLEKLEGGTADGTGV